MKEGISANYSGSLDYWFSKFQWLRFLSINDYPIIMVFWNLFLLLVPFFCARFLIKLYSRAGFQKLFQKIAGVFLFLIWLLFFPNAPYIMTDLRHISGYCPGADFTRVCSEGAWMIPVFFLYALLGWIAFICLLNQMRAFLEKWKGKKMGVFFPVIIIPFSSLGVLLGLLNRFNSWEIFLKPGEIFQVSSGYFLNWTYFQNWAIFTIVFFVLYYVGNYLFRSFYISSE